jgi:rubredoxin/uncharacterized membrane protein
MSQKWKCNVCGYLHDGPEPIPRCPRCGAEGHHFIPLERARFNLLSDLWVSFVPHAVLSHFPSGLIPTALLFLLLFLTTGSPSFGPPVFFLMAIAWLAVPFLIATGLYDWRKRFGGVRATIFYKKIALASALFLTGALALGLRVLHPDIVRQEGLLHGLFLGLLGAMALLTVLLGHYGGKLALQWKKKKG